MTQTRSCRLVAGGRDSERGGGVTVTVEGRTTHAHTCTVQFRVPWTGCQLDWSSCRGDEQLAVNTSTAQHATAGTQRHTGAAENSDKSNSSSTTEAPEQHLPIFRH